MLTPNAKSNASQLESSPIMPSALAQDALSKARILAGRYGHTLERPVVYTQGVALTARLELAQIDAGCPCPADEITAIVADYLADPDATFSASDGTANFAGINWASELLHVDGARELLVRTADRFLAADSGDSSAVLDPDYRVEDMFFAATVLRRASDVTGDPRYLDIANRFLLDCADNVLQPNGLYWHCLSSPYFWGRGNGFAALGYSEALRGAKSAHTDALVANHVAHLEGLRGFQDSDSGMWRQVIDAEDTYTEMSATCMIGISIASGIKSGWLDREEWVPVVESAWRGTSEGLGANGEVTRVCVGTGPLESLDDYRDRDFVTGFDDRGGAMALWFAVEMLRLHS